MGSFMCDGPFGSLAFLHLFGAAARGPYDDGQRNIDGTAVGCNITAPPPPGVSCAYVADTADRLPLGLAAHAAQLHGLAPTLVVYQSLLWDVLPMTRNLSVVPSAAQRAVYARNVGARLRWLRAALPPQAALVTRTTPVGGRTSPPHAATAAMNGELRRIAAAEGVPLLDLDAVLAAHPRDAILRDNTHLNEAFSAATAQLLMRIAHAVADAARHGAAAA